MQIYKSILNKSIKEMLKFYKSKKKVQHIAEPFSDSNLKQNKITRKTINLISYSNIQINMCLNTYTYKQKQIYLAIKLKIYIFFFR